MNAKERSLRILQDCIEQLASMTPEQIKERLKETGLDQLKEDFEDDSHGFSLIIPVSEPDKPNYKIDSGKLVLDNFYLAS